MKKLILATATLLAAAYCHAQQTALGCKDGSIRLQAEQIKHDFRNQGLVSIKDMMITMQSREPAGIKMPFTQGTLYQLVFIGSKDASNLRFEIYDGANFRIEDRKLEKPAETNFLIYSFTPEKTDTFTVVLTQNMDSKTMCGSFTVLRNDNAPAGNKAKK
jgi:hypothetical protein